MSLIDSKNITGFLNSQQRKETFDKNKRFMTIIKVDKILKIEK